MANDKHKKQELDKELGQEKQFQEFVVQIDRVARVVKGGRRFRFRALVVIGDGKGKVGIGVNKGSDVQAAVQKAVDVAKKNVVEVPISNNTLPHDSYAKVAGAKVKLMPASEGTGLIAGGVVRTVVEAAGYKNVLSKSLGSSNKINCAYATVEALKALVPEKDWINSRPAKKASEKKVKETAKESK